MAFRPGSASGRSIPIEDSDPTCPCAVVTVLTLPPAVRLFLCRDPTDMRRSFDGLMMLVEHVLRQDPFSGHLFIFRNKGATRIKIMHWDRNGFAIWYKRLEKGRFQFPSAVRDEIESSEMTLMLDGIILDGARRKPRYEPPQRKFSTVENPR